METIFDFFITMLAFVLAVITVFGKNNVTKLRKPKTEVFKPRKNMKWTGEHWTCIDESGKLVCDGGPSMISDNGNWIFYSSGKLHRLDGPATT